MNAGLPTRLLLTIGTNKKAAELVECCSVGQHIGERSAIGRKCHLDGEVMERLTAKFTFRQATDAIRPPSPSPSPRAAVGKPRELEGGD